MFRRIEVKRKGHGGNEREEGTEDREAGTICWVGRQALGRH